MANDEINMTIDVLDFTVNFLFEKNSNFLKIHIDMLNQKGITYNQKEENEQIKIDAAFHSLRQIFDFAIEAGKRIIAQK